MANVWQDAEELKCQLWGSFLLFCRTFFPLVTGREFLISKPIGRESHFITIARELTKAARLQTTSLLINVPPGSGKSSLLALWVAWTMSRYPDSQYLYIGYGHELAAKHTEFIRRIIQCSHYRTLFGVDIRNDMKAKDHFMTTAGGSVKAFGSSGPVTGVDGGLPNLDRFSGAIICLPYDEFVHTENGLMKIGYLVENKISTKVWSYSFSSKKYELKQISDWYSNPGSDILEITCTNGVVVKLTPNHEVWTDNRGWVQAKDLTIADQLLSPSPYCSLRNSEDFSRIPLLYLYIFKSFELALSKFFKFRFYYSFRLFFNSIFDLRFSSLSSSNFSYVNMADVINNSYFSCRKRAKNNIFNILGGKLGSGMPISHRKGSMFNGIFHVVGLRTVAKVFASIVKPIAVYMPGFNANRLRSDKCPSDKSVDKNLPCFMVSARKGNPPVFFGGINSLFFNFCFRLIRFAAVRVKTNARLLSNLAKVRNRVKPLITRNVFPLFIRNVGHTPNTYCINIEVNHNFLAGSGKGLIVSNCDDLHKPDETHSTTIRERVIQNYRETILQRPRGPNVPIIYIGQRLHEDDLPAFLLSGKDERVWNAVVLKSIDGAGNALYPEVNPLEQLREKQDKNPYVFASQFQQDPIPAGGALFQAKNFPILNEEPQIFATFITADTAETSKSYNDATVFSFWGLYNITEMGIETGQVGLHWLDCVEIWAEPKDLKPEFLSFYGDCMLHKVKPLFAAIEKKSTGVTLISILEDMRGLQIREVKRTKASGSKTERFLEMQPIIAAKLVSFTEGARHKDMCVNHMMKITANDSHKRDDICDTSYDAIKLTLIDKDPSLINPKLGVNEDRKVSALAQHFANLRQTQQNSWR